MSTIVAGALGCMLALAVGSCSHRGRGTPPQDLTDELPEVLDCSEGLVLWSEYGVCAPRVDPCSMPWELPLVGGGCVIVGPRACPKAWDEDAEAECEAGELLDCPENFVLTDDEAACIPYFDEDCGEMELPLPGGGCAMIGPDWGEAGEPYFDHCGPGLLALLGGGCAQVGPRACPRLWDPAADADCEAGDVLPCEKGSVESDNGLNCIPVYDHCPFGERPVLGGGCQRVVPLEADCPPGTFPEAPEGAADPVYVLASSDCAENCNFNDISC